MRVTYIGHSHERIVSTDDLTKGGLDMGEEVFSYVWSSGETLDVDDRVGEFLLEVHRDQFKSGDVINRDLRSRDELYHLAQELQIPGRTNMNKDELAEAVDAVIASRANDSEGAQTPQDLLDQLDAEGI